MFLRFSFRSKNSLWKRRSKRMKKRTQFASLRLVGPMFSRNSSVLRPCLALSELDSTFPNVLSRSLVTRPVSLSEISRRITEISPGYIAHRGYHDSTTAQPSTELEEVNKFNTLSRTWSTRDSLLFEFLNVVLRNPAPS